MIVWDFWLYYYKTNYIIYFFIKNQKIQNIKFLSKAVSIYFSTKIRFNYKNNYLSFKLAYF